MSEMNGFKDAADQADRKFAECPLAKQFEKEDNINMDNISVCDAPIVKEMKEPIKNKLDGPKTDEYELKPNCEFTIDGVTYKTDEQGRIILCDGKAVATPEGERDTKAQAMAGGPDRKEGDQGGHILARIFGGAKGMENLLAMRGTAINESVYKRMENAISKEVKADRQVHFHADIAYDGDSKRPSKFVITYTVEGRETVVYFDNDEGSTDLLDILEDKIDERGYDDLKQEIQDAEDDGTEMSVVSVKEEYNKDGNVTKISVTIRDESADHPVNEDRVYIVKENS